MKNIGILVGTSDDKRAAAIIRMARVAFPQARCTTINLHAMLPRYWVKKPGTKAKRMATDEAKELFLPTMQQLVKRGGYDAFITADLAFANYVLPEKDAKSITSTDVLAGMLVDVADVPALFICDPLHTYGRQYTAEYRAVYAFMTQFHMRKLGNKVSGMGPLEKPTKFFIAKSRADLRALADLAAKSELIAFDIETSGGQISVIGFACEVNGLDYVPVFVIPVFINITDCDGMYWDSRETFSFALDTIGEILANPAPKVAHNGSFDISWLFRYGWYVNKYLFDTMHMLHSTWPTLPKALYVGAGLFLPGYRYWKDDGKEVDDQGKAKWEAPKTPDRTYGYWYYNALDCANTLELALAILRMWKREDKGRFPVFQPGYDHAWRNYIREFMLQFGPALSMSMRGLRQPEARQHGFKERMQEEYHERLEELRELIGEPDFNPNSTPQKQWLLYDAMGMKPLPRKGRTTDKRITQMLADQHPIYAEVIGAVTAAMEPRNEASKYGSMPSHNGRFIYSLKAGNTTTWRFASSRHHFGIGTNVQNIKKSTRALFVADEGEMLASTDYSQSDSYFVAFESQDPTMIETVLDDRDTHSVHVEFFFGHKYEDVVAGNKKKEAWVVDPVSGVRQIIKKVSHGTNYDMGGGTMLINIRRPAALAMTRAILHSPNAGKFLKFMGLDQEKPPSYYATRCELLSNSQLERACEFAQALYYHRYPVTKRWKSAAVQEATRKHGLVPMFGGTTTVMLCSPKLNPRFVPASYGQGGTSGNINNAMLRLYFLCQDMWDEGFAMVIQVHDELVCAIPRGKYHLVQRKVEVMETECEIHGRKFTVPVEAELTLSWQAKHTVKFRGLDKAAIASYDKDLIEHEALIEKQMGSTFVSSFT